MEEKRILLLGATFGSGNMGVCALTAGSIEACLLAWQNAKILLLDYEKTPVTFQYSSMTGPVEVELLNLRFSKRVFLRNNIALLIVLATVLKLVPFSLRRYIVLRNKYLNEIDKADFTFAISGGDSFSDIYGLRRFLYVSLPQILVEIMAKKIVLLPQTIGPFNGWFAGGLARYILKRASVIYSRDFLGMKELKELLGEYFDGRRLRFCYDVGFAVNPVRQEKMDTDGFEDRDRHYPAVGFNVSGLLWMGGYKQNNQFGLKTDYRLLIERLISHFIEEKNATVLLIPHVFEEEEDSESDQIICKKLYQDLKGKFGNRLYLARGRYDQSGIKYIIGLCDFFIGSRMHACIGALSQCIPAVPIAYSKKFIGVMETIGVEQNVADPRTMNAEEIVGVVDKAWNGRKNIRLHLEKKIPEVKKRVLNLFKEIDDELGKKT